MVGRSASELPLSAKRVPATWATARRSAPCIRPMEVVAISVGKKGIRWRPFTASPSPSAPSMRARSEEHTSELQSQSNLVCRLLLEKKKKIKQSNHNIISKITVHHKLSG